MTIDVEPAQSRKAVSDDALTAASGETTPHNLRAWREHRGMSQDDLAAAVGTRASVISLQERNQRGLTIQWLQRFAAALHTTPGRLLDCHPNDVAAQEAEEDGVPIPISGRRYYEELALRVKQLRRDGGWTAAHMATVLGIPAEEYRKYESRTPLPHHLIEPFARIVDCGVAFVLTGAESSNHRCRSAVRSDIKTETDGQGSH